MTTPTSRDYVIFEINFYTKNEYRFYQDFYYYFRMGSYCKYYYRLFSS